LVDDGKPWLHKIRIIYFLELFDSFSCRLGTCGRATNEDEKEEEGGRVRTGNQKDDRLRKEKQ